MDRQIDIDETILKEKTVINGMDDFILIMIICLHWNKNVPDIIYNYMDMNEYTTLEYLLPHRNRKLVKDLIDRLLQQKYIPIKVRLDYELFLIDIIITYQTNLNEVLEIGFTHDVINYEKSLNELSSAIINRKTFKSNYCDLATSRDYLYYFDNCKIALPLTERNRKSISDFFLKIIRYINDVKQYKHHLRETINSDDVIIILEQTKFTYNECLECLIDNNDNIDKTILTLNKNIKQDFHESLRERL